jgi:hypothetical protein
MQNKEIRRKAILAEDILTLDFNSYLVGVTYEGEGIYIAKSNLFGKEQVFISDGKSVNSIYEIAYIERIYDQFKEEIWEKFHYKLGDKKVLKFVLWSIGSGNWEIVDRLSKDEFIITSPLYKILPYGVDPNTV